jgi:hypothetical protein
MNELGYSGLANDGPMNIAPHQHDRMAPLEPAPVDDDLGQLWARSPDEEPRNTPDEVNPWHREPILDLRQAQLRIEQLEATVEQLGGYISALTLTLSEHIVIPSVAGDSCHAIKTTDFYNDQGDAYQRLLRRCLQGGHRVHPILVPHRGIEGAWKFMFQPDAPTEPEEPKGPPTAWDRISSDD